MVKGIRRIWYLGLGAIGASGLVSRLHRTIYRLSGGRVLGRSTGCQVVLLTTTGRQTGALRTTPLFGFIEEDTVVVAASNAGKARHPAWYLNLQANPEARVQVGPEIRNVRAREATHEEREQLWPRLAHQYPGYEVYRERTSRRIPVVIFEPP